MLYKQDLTFIGRALTKHGFSSLKEYYRSERWSKWKALKRNRLCFCCKKTQQLELHHLTYERLCDEDENDLVWLCPECHEQVHLTYQTMVKEWKETSLAEATILWQSVCKPEPTKPVVVKKGTTANKKNNERERFGSKKDMVWVLPVKTIARPKGRYLLG